MIKETEKEAPFVVEKGVIAKEGWGGRGRNRDRVRGVEGK